VQNGKENLGLKDELIVTHMIVPAVTKSTAMTDSETSKITAKVIRVAHSIHSTALQSYNIATSGNSINVLRFPSIKYIYIYIQGFIKSTIFNHISYVAKTTININES